MAKFRYYLHSKVNSDGRRPLFLSVGIGEARPVRQATGIVVTPALFSAESPYLHKDVDGYRSLNHRLDQLRLDVMRAADRLAEDGQLSNATLAPLVKALAIASHGRVEPAAPATPAVPKATPIKEQTLQQVYTQWKEENGAEFSATYLNKGRQYVDWMDKFDAHATPERIDEKWVKRYTKFLVQDTPLFNNTIHQHLNMLRALLQQAGLNTKWIKNTWKHKAEKCYLTLEELQQLHRWEPPANMKGLSQQKDVFIVRCLIGLRYSDSAALLRPHIRSGQQGSIIRLDQQKTRRAVQIPVLPMAQEILSRYQDLPAGAALPVISQQQTGAAIKRMLQLAGIDSPYVRVRYKGTVKHETVLPKWKAAGTHTARHTYGALLARMKMDPISIRDLMGHSDLKSTLDYIHLENDRTESEMLTAWDKLNLGL